MSPRWASWASLTVSVPAAFCGLRIVCSTLEVSELGNSPAPIEDNYFIYRTSALDLTMYSYCY